MAKKKKKNPGVAFCFFFFYCRTESISETVCTEGLSGSRVFIKKRTGIGSNQLADLLMKSVRALAFIGIKKKKTQQPSLQWLAALKSAPAASITPFRNSAQMSKSCYLKLLVVFHSFVGKKIQHLLKEHCTPVKALLKGMTAKGEFLNEKRDNWVHPN